MEALNNVAVANSSSVGNEWLEFCKQYAAGAHTFNNVKSDDRLKQHNASTTTYQSADQVDTTHSWQAPDLMAKLYHFQFNFAWPGNQPLEISVPQGGENATALIYNGNDTSNFLGQTSGSDVFEVTNPGSAVTVLLVNHRAVKPYNSKTPVQLKVAAGEVISSELLDYVKISISFDNNYYGWGPSCNGKRMRESVLPE